MHVRISIKIGGIPFSELLWGFMQEPKMNEKGAFVVFCIENFRNSAI